MLEVSTLLKLVSFTLTLALTGINLAFAQRCTLEQEPNDTPPKASDLTEFGCVVGDLAANDLDIYRLSLPEADLRYHPAVLSVTGIPEQLTRVDLLKLTLTENGEGVLSRQDLLTFSTRTGERTQSEPLLLNSDTYYLAVSKSGSEGRYELEVALSEQNLPGNQEQEPNDSAEDAREQAGAFSLQGDLQGSVDYHRWTLDEEAAAQLWQLSVQAQTGQDVTLKLYSSAGKEVLSLSAEDDLIERSDLAFEPGTYTFVLGPATEENARYTLQTFAQGTRTEGAELEPNDNDTQTNSFDPLVGISGTLRQGERDQFRFALLEPGFYTLDPGLAAEAHLTLTNQTGEPLVNLNHLSPVIGDAYLEAGLYTLILEGAQQDLNYRLQLVPGRAPAAGFEVEPNNLLSYATPLDGALQVRGEMQGRDFDFFSFEVPSPQRFRIQVLAEDLMTLRCTTAGGRWSLR